MHSNDYRKLDELFEISDVFKLSEKEKMHTKKLLKEFIDDTTGSSGSSPQNNTLKKFRLKSSPKTNRIIKLVSILFIVLMLGLGVISVAAEKALPGDKLYPLKINLNEKLRGLLAFSAVSKAEFAFNSANERLKEIETLATKNKLTEDRRNRASAYFKDQIDETYKYLNEVVNEEETQVFIDLNTEIAANLMAHEQVISEMEEQNSLLSQVLSEIRVKKTQAGHIEALGEKRLVENQELTEELATKQLQRAEEQLENSDTLVKEQKNALPIKSQILLEDDLKMSQQLIEKGKQEIKTNDYHEAFQYFQDADKLGQSIEIATQLELTLAAQATEAK